MITSNSEAHSPPTIARLKIVDGIDRPALEPLSAGEAARCRAISSIRVLFGGSPPSRVLVPSRASATRGCHGAELPSLSGHRNSIVIAADGSHTGARPCDQSRLFAGISLPAVLLAPSSAVIAVAPLLPGDGVATIADGGPGAVASRAISLCRSATYPV